jgi:hypothetical protein
MIPLRTDQQVAVGQDRQADSQLGRRTGRQSALYKHADRLEGKQAERMPNRPAGSKSVRQTHNPPIGRGLTDSQLVSRTGSHPYMQLVRL